MAGDRKTWRERRRLIWRMVCGARKFATSASAPWWVGGVSSIWQVRNGLAAAAKQLFAVMTGSHAIESDDPTERNLSGRSIIMLGAVCVTLIAGVYSHLLNGDVGLTALTTLVMLVMSFFFCRRGQLYRWFGGEFEQPRFWHDHHRGPCDRRTRLAIWFRRFWRDCRYPGRRRHCLLRRLHIRRCLQRLENGPPRRRLAAQPAIHANPRRGRRRVCHGAGVDRVARGQRGHRRHRRERIARAAGRTVQSTGGRLFLRQGKIFPPTWSDMACLSASCC